MAVIKAYTPNFSFKEINFDVATWHDQANSNWQMLDAIMSKYFAIPGIVGVWENSTAYAIDDVLVDSTDGTMWQCLVAHNSAASGTFSADRAANPSYWVNASFAMRNRGSWAQLTEYRVGDIVTYSSSVYVTVIQHVSTGVFDASKFEFLLTTGTQNLPAITPADAYKCIWVAAGGLNYELSSVPLGLCAFLNEGTAPNQLPSNSRLGALAYLSTISNALLDALSVSTGKIQDNAITTPKIADGSITAAKIVDGIITTAKIGDNQITFAKMQDLSANVLLGRTASGGDPEEIACTAFARTILAAANQAAVQAIVSTADGSITTAKLDDGAVTNAKVATGFVVAMGYAEDTGNASITTIIPFDNSEPQSGEGTEVFTLAYTAKSATNILHIEVVVPCTASGARDVIAALFVDAEANARATGYVTIGTANYGHYIKITYELVAGTVAAQTFRVRCGLGTAGTLYINRNSTGNLFASTDRTTMTIFERKA